MQCYKCGSIIPENALVCHKCGAEMSVFARRTHKTGVDANPFTSHLPMNWYKFLIIVSLYASAITSFMGGIMYLTGYIYNMQSAGEINAYMIYMEYGKALLTADIAYGALSVAYGIFGFIVRSKLAHFKKNAPRYLYAWYAMGLIISIGYAIATCIIGTAPVSFFAAQLPQFIGEIVLLYLNYIYFSKRKHFFVN
ncbi:MAG: zinc ribbon domain-containing protein [Clostridia bacterium]|nr:zinc ribbon domain-containing protein [Clostridia bacterium]